MATIQAAPNEKVFPIRRFLGLNQSPDGDANLKYGEAAAMQNFKITDDYSLQLRPGTKTVAGLLGAYSVMASSSATTVKTELNAPAASFTAYPSVSVSDTGILSLSGEPVSVNFANIPEFAGYYWQDTNSGLFYKLGSCEYTAASGGTHVTGGAVSIADTESLIWEGNIGDYDDDGRKLTLYDSLTVTSGSVSACGASQRSELPSGTYQYCPALDGIHTGSCYDYTRREIAIYPSAPFNHYKFYGKLISALADDTYRWKFFAVTAEAGASETAVCGLWSGYVGGNEYLIAACNGALLRLSESAGVWTKTSVGTVCTEKGRVHMFGFGEKLYLLDGENYRVWDGTALSNVEGYRPLVITEASPATGGGTALEPVNKLCGARRVRFSPGGAAFVFQLSETGLSSIDYVKNTVSGVSYTPGTDYGADALLGRVTFVAAPRTETFTGDGISKVFALTNKNVNIGSVAYVSGGTTYTLTAGTDYLYSLAKGTVTLTSASVASGAYTVTETVTPALGTDTVEIGYTCPANFRAQVTAMRFSETFNGETDTRVFLYGDGTNKALYSGLDTDGAPRADYFPDLNEMTVDSANTPITAMIKHFDKLLAFKADGAYVTSYGTLTLADGRVTAGFCTTPLSREIGNAAPGQVRLVKNDPFTLFEGGVYAWRMSSFYAKDERLAKKVSDRVYQTLSAMSLPHAVCFDDIVNGEYWLCEGGNNLVYSYGADVWYLYTGFTPLCFANLDGALYFGDGDGNVRGVSRDYRNDNGANLVAYWESGSLSFGADWLKKYSPCLWVGIKPESSGFVRVTVQTDRQTDYPDARVLSDFSGGVTGGFFSFFDLDFSRLSFNVNDKPQMHRLKLRVKKFTFYKLIFSSDSNNTTATVTGADIRVRYTNAVR